MEKPPSQERRKSTRIARHQHVEIKRVSQEGEPALTGQVMNISEGGARFYTSIELAADEPLKIMAGDQEFRAKVLDCAKRFSGYAVRAAFIEE